MKVSKKKLVVGLVITNLLLVSWWGVLKQKKIDKVDNLLENGQMVEEKKEVGREHFVAETFGLIVQVARKIPSFGLKSQEATIAQVGVPESTGAEKGYYPVQLSVTLKSFADLRGKTPMDQGWFKIEFDYQHNRFIVKMDDLSETGKNAFYQWVDDNGYKLIDKDKFVFKNLN